MTALHDLLYGDHARLERHFKQLHDAVEGADAPTIQDTWARFESGLVAHMDAEERHILPVVVEVAPEVVERVRTDHERIRTLVSELGVATDLKSLRKETADTLLETLREHAAYENRTLYLHADQLLTDRAKDAARRFLEEEGRRRYGAWEAMWA